MKKAVDMVQAVRKFCDICNKDCSKEDHEQYVYSLLPKNASQKLKNILLGARQHQAILDEYGTWEQEQEGGTKLLLELRP